MGKKTYRITSKTGGMVLGDFEGRDEREAIEAMWEDANAAPEHRDAEDLDVREVQAASEMR